MSDSITISGNVSGSVVVGDNNFVVNTNHGTIVYQQAAPQVQKRTLAPAPPRAPRGFVNRTSELARLESWIQSSEIVLLHAPDGLGKTALLKQAANSPAARARPDGVILLESVDASGQALGPEDILQRLFDALFESNPPLKVNATTARTYLSNTRPLVLFDEVPLTPALQNALPDILPNAALVLTADLPTGGDFERLSIKPLPRPESLTLLADKAAITLNDHNRNALDAICALLDDAPLALTITGNVLRETSDSPDAALSYLRETPETSPDHLRSALDRAFAYAFSRLNPEEQQVLAVAAQTPALSSAPDWLSYALGGIPLEAALARLQAIGLLYANSPRLRLPPGFRAPAQKEASKQVQAASLMAKLSEYLLSNQSQPGFIAAELGNFAAAISASNGETALALARAIDPYLTINGLWDLWGRTLSSALDAAKSLGNRSAEAWALHQMGTRLIGLGQNAQAELLLNQALKLRQAIGDTAGAAYSRHNLQILRPLPVPEPQKFRWPWQSPVAVGAPARGGAGAGAMVGVFVSAFALLALAAAVFLVGLPLLLPVPASDPATETVAPSVTPTVKIITVTPSQTPTASPSPTPDKIHPTLGKLRTEPQESSYGQFAERCQQETTLTLFAYAEDPSGLEQVQVIYWYQFSAETDDEADEDNDTPRYEAQMKAGENGQYSLLLDHNEQNRAETSLGGQGGWMHWQVIATDKFGNQVTQTGPPVPLAFAQCDTSGPATSRAYTLPGTGTYGDFQYCGTNDSSYMEFHAILKEESRITSVIVQYNYRLNNFNGPTYTVKLSPYKSDPSHYFTAIDHNSGSQANRTLKEQNGQLTWQVIATDEYGNIATSPSYLIEIRYRFCPPPG